MKRPPVVVEELLTPKEAAALFGVSVKSVRRWVDGGRLSAVKTLGGHRRLKAAEVRELATLRGPRAAVVPVELAK